MNYIIPTTVSVFVLAGCGGGGTLTAEIDRDYSEDNTIATDVMKEYSNGDAVVAFKGVLQDGSSTDKPRYYFVLSQDADAAIDTFNGVVVWEDVETTLDSGNLYGVIRQGVNAKGQSVYVDSYGRNLNNSGSEYASVSYVKVGETNGYVTAGSTITRMPSGSFTYDGGSIIRVESIQEGSDDGFVLIADFSNKQASFTAVTDNLFASAANLQIDMGTGSFSGNEAYIGERNTTFSIPATVIGAFAGSNAGGVHGIVYPTMDNSDDGFAVFLGER